MAILTNAEAIDAFQAIQKLARQPLPIKSALKVRRLFVELKCHVEDVQAVHQDLLKQHCRTKDGELEVDDKGQMPFLGDASKLSYWIVYKELMSETCEVAGALAEGDLGTTDIEPSILIGLGSLLE